MKLSYSIPGKIWWITNFLDYKTYKGIHDAVIKERKKINLSTSKGNWDDLLIKNIVPPLTSRIGKYPLFEILKILVKHNAFFQIKDAKELSTVIHYMEKNSGINWHDDNKWKYGATYYLNHRWCKQWGGEFMFTHKEGHGWIPPVGNSLVIVKAPVEHKVNPVLSPIMPRMTVQIFMR